MNAELEREVRAALEPGMPTTLDSTWSYADLLDVDGAVVSRAQRALRDALRGES